MPVFVCEPACVRVCVCHGFQVPSDAEWNSPVPAFSFFFFFVGLGLHVFEDCAKFWNLRGLFLVLFLVLRLFIVEDQCW